VPSPAMLRKSVPRTPPKNDVESVTGSDPTVATVSIPSPMMLRKSVNSLPAKTPSWKDSVVIPSPAMLRPASSRALTPSRIATIDRPASSQQGKSLVALATTGDQPLIPQTAVGSPSTLPEKQVEFSATVDKTEVIVEDKITAITQDISEGEAKKLVELEGPTVADKALEFSKVEKPSERRLSSTAVSPLPLELKGSRPPIGRSVSFHDEDQKLLLKMSKDDTFIKPRSSSLDGARPEKLSDPAITGMADASTKSKSPKASMKNKVTSMFEKLHSPSSKTKNRARLKKKNSS